MIKLLAFAYLLSGCAILDDLMEKINPQKDPTLENREDLVELYNDRLSAIDWHNGIPSLLDCDGALWAGVAAVGGVATHLEDFIYPEVGKTQRRPGTPCYPDDLDGNGHPDSRSTTSNDMIIGLGYGLYVQGKFDLINGIVQYGKMRDWFMGEPHDRIGEVVLKPNVQITLQRSIGVIAPAPTFYNKPKEDYQYHIQVLNILWEGEREGNISKNALDRLSDAANAYPHDYLFNAALGAYTGDMAPV
jgi:hypothetical protein